MTWRERAAPIIVETIQRVGRDDQKALRQALRAAYPFAERSGYAYKAWCAEVRAQLGSEFMRSDMTAARAGQVDAFK